MKTVEYMGGTYEVPTWAAFIAADRSGDVFVYDKEPVWIGDEWWAHGVHAQMVGEAPPPQLQRV